MVLRTAFFLSAVVLMYGCGSARVADHPNRGLLQSDEKVVSSSIPAHELDSTDLAHGTSSSGYIWPVKDAKISSPFGDRALKLKRKKSRRGIARVHFHEGIDIKAFRGSPIFAVREGTVIYSSRRIKGYGNMIVIQHPDGMATVYAHNRKNLVSRGDQVAQGELIGYVGATGKATGPHLHFEIRKGELPEDPMKYLPPLPAPVAAKSEPSTVAQKEVLEKRVN